MTKSNFLERVEALCADVHHSAEIPDDEHRFAPPYRKPFRRFFSRMTNEPINALRASEFFDDAPYTAVQIGIDEMVKSGEEVIYQPDEVVFKDAPSTVFSADGKELEPW